MGIQVVRMEVDLHEPEKVRAELARLGVEVLSRPLQVGDYRMRGVMVERKRVRDLHLTLASGRLW